MGHTARTRFILITVLALGSLMLSGCGLLSGSGPEPTPAPEERALVPTFTPTMEGAAPDSAPAVGEAQQAAPEQAEQQPVPADTPTPMPEEAAPEEPTPEEPTPEPPTPAPVAKIIVTIPMANARNGPGTEYGLAGSVTQNQAFDITGRNDAGTWWQFCCVNGQEAWIFGELVSTENADNVPVAQNIPPPPEPVAAAPPPADPAPADPAPADPAPADPAPAEAPAPPPAEDPCAGIGGDGCKFHVRNGPLFAGNGGGELKLQLFFIHSGVDGGQPQGSYFIVVLKDGVKLPISDSVRSIALERSEGPLGPYNYEYKVGLGDIPGNNVAGNYTMYVLDGNGERDSRDLNFTVPEGQGEVWVEWDQG